MLRTISDSRLVTKTKLGNALKDEYLKMGYFSVSQGKLAVIIQAAGTSETLFKKTGRPCAMFTPKLPRSHSLIEILIKRARSLGNFCTALYGRNFDRDDEPISILLITNEIDFDSIQMFMMSNDNFGYKNITMLAQVLPR